MKIHIFDTEDEMARSAAKHAAEALKLAIAARGQAAFVAATGASQKRFLEALTADSSVRWDKTTMFHLDEYVGITDAHPASFRRYLRERLINKVHPGHVHLIRGEAADPQAEASRISRIISEVKIDVALVGVGENGHLAFNDPPADFGTERPFIVVSLDEACRKQQVGEGWFSSFTEVPQNAITMSVRQILKASTILCVVPEKRKALAVRGCFGDATVSPLYPASILKEHPEAHVYLDRQAASLLKASGQD